MLESLFVVAVFIDSSTTSTWTSEVGEIRPETQENSPRKAWYFWVLCILRVCILSSDVVSTLPRTA